MAQRDEERLVVGLDVGTTKICCLVAVVDENGAVSVKGQGTALSTGMAEGQVVNMQQTIASIKEAVDEAQRASDCMIKSACVGVAGRHIRSFNSNGVVAIRNRHVSEEDIKRVIEGALTVKMPLDRELLHSIAQEFVVDNFSGIKAPLGMQGVRLEANVHVVTGDRNAIGNIVNCVLKSGLDIKDLVLESVASAEAVLQPSERSLGVALIDMGGGTSDIALYCGDSIRFSAVVGMGGDNLTHDVAVKFRTDVENAELLKCTYGCCLSSLIEEDLNIEVPTQAGDGVMLVRRSTLCDQLELRVEEILKLVNHQLINSGYDKNINSVVLTGGSSLLPGMTELAEQIFDRRVRRGSPNTVVGLSEIVEDPRFSTAVGLVLHTIKNRGVQASSGPRNSQWLKRWCAKIFGEASSR
ncbi:MAG: cell division protein FtsA [Deltaproteobacteria bacterium]|jgi:cell division protein FtsA|nr:cell division protein FtsA [Deltaproteobacteria bacterium]